MAVSSIWILAASVLATFDIQKAIDDKTGLPIEPTQEYHSALIWCVLRDHIWRED